MSPTPASLRRDRSAGIFQSEGIFRTERRANQRYPITLEVEYKVPSANAVRQKGFGRTINISSRGVLLDISDPLPILCPIQLSINWPFLLDRSVALKLLLYGEIVRVLGNRIAVKVTGHTFHTTGHANAVNVADT